MTQPFLIDPANVDLAGRVQKVPAGQSGCLLVFFSFFLIVGAPFFYLMGRGLHGWWRLREAAVVEATVLSRETDDSGKRQLNRAFERPIQRLRRPSSKKASQFG